MPNNKKHETQLQWYNTWLFCNGAILKWLYWRTSTGI